MMVNLQCSDKHSIDTFVERSLVTIVYYTFVERSLVTTYSSNIVKVLNHAIERSKSLVIIKKASYNIMYMYIQMVIY